MKTVAIRRKRRGKKKDKVKHAAKAVLVVLGLILGLSFWLYYSPTSKVSLPSDVSVDLLSSPAFRNTAIAALHLGASVEAERPVYPYSVIPGGARNSKELQAAFRNDPTVASHYSDFDAHSVHVIRVQRAKQVFVSYRLGDRIYWTSKRVTLHAGETLLTDGTHFARTRCGNRISELPTNPTSPSEPVPGLMDKPLLPGNSVDLSEATMPSPIWSDPSAPLVVTLNGPTEPLAPAGNDPFFPLLPPPLCCGGFSDPSPSPGPLPQPYPVEPRVATPEPGTLVLILCSAPLLLILWKFRSF